MLSRTKNLVMLLAECHATLSLQRHQVVNHKTNRRDTHRYTGSTSMTTVTY